MKNNYFNIIFLTILRAYVIYKKNQFFEVIIMPESGLEKHSFCTHWIKDGIKKDYVDWLSLNSIKKRNIEDGKHNFFKKISRVFIESPTGTGKSTFIFKNLIPQIASDKKRHSHSILYLGNRDALKLQIGKNIESLHSAYAESILEDNPSNSNLKKYYYDDGDNKACLYISNYQSMLKQINMWNFGSVLEIDLKEDIEIVIFDEVHFFLDDSLFNPFTELIFERLIMRFKNSAMVFMSATLDEAKEWIVNMINQCWSGQETQTGLISNRFIYYKNTYAQGNYKLNLYTNYSQILHIIENCAESEKWIIFVSSKKRGRELMRRLSEMNIRASFLSADTKNSSAWNQIVEDESFSANVLITTKVLDNGSNILNPYVRHIVLPFCCKTDFVQMLGRRRITDNRVINIYAELPDEKKVKSYIKETKKKLNTLDTVINMRNGMNFNVSVLQKLWLTGDKSINKLFYIDNRASLVPNYAAVYKLVELLYFYEDMLKKTYDPDAYIELLSSWLLSKTLDNTIYLDSASGESIKSIDEFIECYKNVPLKPNSIYDEFIRVYKNECYMKYSKDEFNEMMNIKKAKNIRKATINHALEKLGKPYKILKIKNRWILSEID